MQKSLLLFRILASTMTLMACQGPLNPDNNATLNSLRAISWGEERSITPPFSSEVSQYQVNLPPGTESLQLRMDKSSATARYKESAFLGMAADNIRRLTLNLSGDQLQISGLQKGRNQLKTEIVAADGTTKAYTLVMNVLPGDINVGTSSTSADAYNLYSDGTTLWVVGWDSAALFAYDLNTKARKSAQDFSSLSSDNDTPRGIWANESFMWVADNSEAKIFAYQRSTKNPEPTKDLTGLRTAGNESPTGLWSNGTVIWVADNEDSKIYAYNITTGARLEDKEFNTLSEAGNKDPGGMWSDGTTMWVVDEMDQKVYAYNMVSKAHEGTKDFTTLVAAGNDYPFGLWSDGTTMWISDVFDNKVYAYRLSNQSRTP